MIGRSGQPPTPPLSLLGDFAGGGYPLVVGVLSALLARQSGAPGQVVDAAMVEGAALLATPFLGLLQAGAWAMERGTNLLDSGAPFYDVYRTADDQWIAIGALERRFYDQLRDMLGLSGDLPDQYDRAGWAQLRERIAATVVTRTRDEWVAAASTCDACVEPVLDPLEAPHDDHAVARGSFVEVDGIVQPSPVPRFSRTPAAIDRPPPTPGEHTRAVMEEWGVRHEQVEKWISGGVMA